jgi:spermidine synthase
VDRRARAFGFVAAVLAAIAAAAAVPGTERLWTTLHGASRHTVIAGEDGSGVSVLRMDRRRTLVFVNGTGQSWIPYGGIHTVLGALPAFVHPQPRTAALVGLGSGDTLFALAGRRELQRITSIEIVEPQLETLRGAAALQGYPGLTAWLGDPRIEHVAGDGRTYIARSGRRFDIIEADALRPTSAYSGHLYSDAYFELLRAHLAPGGLAVSWAPTARVARTFVKVFPHVWQHGPILIGSETAVRVDADAVLRRMADRDVQRYYAAGRVDLDALLRPYLTGGHVFDPSYDRSSIRDINTDLFPRDEFGLEGG